MHLPLVLFLPVQPVLWQNINGGRLGLFILGGRLGLFLPVGRLGVGGLAGGLAGGLTGGLTCGLAGRWTGRSGSSTKLMSGVDRNAV